LHLGAVGIKLNFEGRKSNKKVMALAFSVRCVARFVERMTGLTWRKRGRARFVYFNFVQAGGALTKN
jgi:hypothetical protein